MMKIKRIPVSRSVILPDGNVYFRNRSDWEKAILSDTKKCHRCGKRRKLTVVKKNPKSKYYYSNGAALCRSCNKKRAVKSKDRHWPKMTHLAKYDRYPVCWLRKEHVLLDLEINEFELERLTSAGLIPCYRLDNKVKDGTSITFFDPVDIFFYMVRNEELYDTKLSNMRNS